MIHPIVKSIQIGLPRTVTVRGDHGDASWRTGFFKDRVTGPVCVRKTNIDGDGQADLSVHGGADKAVLAYAADHYNAWRADLEIAELPYGAFGENLTLAHQMEQDVCIGDQFRCGDVLFQLSQPRQPCWKLGRRWQLKTLPQLVIRSGRSGWYLAPLRSDLDARRIS